MSVYVLEFELKGLPKMANQLLRGHWATKVKHAQDWKRKVCDECRLHVKPAQPLISAVLLLTRYSSVEPDFDGLVSGFKPIIDGLVEAEVLSNDKVSVIGQPKYFWERCRQRMGKVRVRVEARP